MSPSLPLTVPEIRSNPLRIVLGVASGASRNFEVVELSNSYTVRKLEEREARAYNGCLGAVPPVGSRGKAPGQGAKPPGAEEFLANETQILQ